jgi:hypothetical protein
MASTPVPYDIKARRDRFVPDDLDDATAAGIVAAGCDIEVTAVHPAGSAEGTPGKAARDIYATVYAVVTGDGNEARYSYSPVLPPGTERSRTAARAVQLRAQRITDLAGALMRGEPAPEVPVPARPTMTPDQMQRAERDAALNAVAHALTMKERQQFLAAVARQWPRLVGAHVNDVLEYTTDYDLFLGQTEPFYAQLPVDFPGGPAVIFALHALIILGQPLTTTRVLKLLIRAGVIDDSPEVRDAVVAEVAGELASTWNLAHCTQVGYALDEGLAVQLARHAMSRLCVIRDRDHIDPLPH